MAILPVQPSVQANTMTMQPASNGSIAPPTEQTLGALRVGLIAQALVPRTVIPSRPVARTDVPPAIIDRRPGEIAESIRAEVNKAPTAKTLNDIYQAFPKGQPVVIPPHLWKQFVGRFNQSLDCSALKIMSDGKGGFVFAGQLTLAGCLGTTSHFVLGTNDKGMPVMIPASMAQQYFSTPHTGTPQQPLGRLEELAGNYDAFRGFTSGPYLEELSQLTDPKCAPPPGGQIPPEPPPPEPPPIRGLW